MRVLIALLLLSACRDGDDSKTETGHSGADTDQEVVEGTQDADGDGFIDDCDDTNPDIFPGAAEICDGLDNDCNNIVDDGAVDATAWYLDSDGDGYGDVDEETFSCEAPVGHVVNSDDCDDADARFNPSAIESDCEDENDYNCDGSVGWEDADADGFAACADCDDSDAAVNDDAIEICNETDDNCNGLTDEDDPELADGSMFYGDSDGDGHGGQQYEALSCDAPAGFVDNNNDCNDLNPDTYPSAAEVCDDEDNDCDGDTDEGVGLTWYADVDGDGYGDATASITSCDAPQGYTANGNDCDDAAAATNPSAYEVCDGIDNNCDGSTDDSSALNTSTFYADTDGDGYGDAASAVSGCEAPTNHVSNDSDCDDASAAINPAADELCDSADNNCNGTVDEASAVDASTWYTDADNDTYGNASISQTACTAPAGHVADSSDCDDTSATTNPSATETCNGVDDNCDGSIDEGVLTTWYADLDSDGYGSAISQDACSAPAAYVSNNLDCDDVDTSVNPGALEVCDASDTDEDCDGAADDNDPEGASGTTLYYPDVDGDGYGDLSDAGTGYCDDAGALVTDNTDCDDSSTGSGINPGATDTWYDGEDSDCDGASDYDADGDGFDSEDHSGTDCNDNNATVNTGCFLYDFTTHDFTNCSQSGPTGPSLSQCTSAYSTAGDWDENTSYFNMVTNGIQRWTVPATASYRITATGAAGQSNSNSSTGGQGASIQGEFDLTQGDIIDILVGQMGTSNTQHGNENGGGGGSFVALNATTVPLLVAGGGGGAPANSYGTSCSRTNGDGQISQSGKTVSCYATGSGGSGGNGGSVGGNGTNTGGGCEHGAAGGGFYTDGANGGDHCSRSQGGDSFTNGGVGGQINTCYGTAHGGFGGGGTGNLGSPGGAGGYSGGGSDGCWSSYSDFGGGGGSYNDGASQVNTAGQGSGQGSVVIAFIELN